ncbi:MAG: hypothetical protein OXG10_03730, partial [Candidatus Dadabacteria bacterium]|nr:hypothetical protein [Candidatus Dadabacteria bacterium]
MKRNEFSYDPVPPPPVNPRALLRGSARVSAGIRDSLSASGGVLVLVFFALAFFLLARDARAQIDCNTFTYPSNPTDADVLKKLYCDTGGNSWPKKTNWGASDLNTWQGVTAQNNKVTSLELDSNQLTGTIPAELGNLTSLTTRLRLDSNQLTGTIPAELGDLTSLDFLYLHSNQLTGTIPAELGDLAGLQLLALYSNQLTGSIPSELGNLSVNLNTLRLDGNKLTGTIPTELGDLTRLQWLYLHTNQLTGSIPSELGSL